jgi:hypothetical protein
MTENIPNSPPAETDDRFPSGPWIGFWLQKPHTGRQWMRDLVLNFSDGSVEGRGSDCVGPFTIAGQYDTQTGQCTLLKQYIAMHSVTYAGHNDGDGQWLWGIWTLPNSGERGGFHLWPKGTPDPTGASLKAEEPVPIEEPVPA